MAGPSFSFLFHYFILCAAKEGRTFARFRGIQSEERLDDP